LICRRAVSTLGVGLHTGPEYITKTNKYSKESSHKARLTYKTKKLQIKVVVYKKLQNY